MRRTRIYLAHLPTVLRESWLLIPWTALVIYLAITFLSNAFTPQLRYDLNPQIDGLTDSWVRVGIAFSGNTQLTAASTDTFSLQIAAGPVLTSSATKPPLGYPYTKYQTLSTKLARQTGTSLIKISTGDNSVSLRLVNLMPIMVQTWLSQQTMRFDGFITILFALAVWTVVAVLIRAFTAVESQPY